MHKKELAASQKDCQHGLQASLQSSKRDWVPICAPCCLHLQRLVHVQSSSRSPSLAVFPTSLTGKWPESHQATQHATCHDGPTATSTTMTQHAGRGGGTSYHRETHRCQPCQHIPSSAVPPCSWPHSHTHRHPHPVIMLKHCQKAAELSRLAAGRHCQHKHNL